MRECKCIDVAMAGSSTEAVLKLSQVDTYSVDPAMGSEDLRELDVNSLAL